MTRLGRLHLRRDPLFFSCTISPVLNASASCLRNALPSEKTPTFSARVIHKLFYRCAVLGALSSLTSASVDLEGGIANVIHGATEMDRRFNPVAPLARRLHLDHIHLDAWGVHVHGCPLLFRHDETERCKDFGDGRHHFCQARLRSRHDASIVSVQHAAKTTPPNPRHSPSHELWCDVNVHARKRSGGSCECTENSVDLHEVAHDACGRS